MDTQQLLEILAELSAKGKVEVKFEGDVNLNVTVNQKGMICITDIGKTRSRKNIKDIHSNVDSFAPSSDYGSNLHVVFSKNSSIEDSNGKKSFWEKISGWIGKIAKYAPILVKLVSTWLGHLFVSKP